MRVPTSKEYTWDAIVGRGLDGPDVAIIDQALESTFSCYAVDPTHIAIGGFSDGASYALSLGITNGDLFTHVLAFSPGFMALAGQAGSPRIFISHGTGDEVLPIDHCSRRIVPQLRRAGYDVRYRESGKDESEDEVTTKDRNHAANPAVCLRRRRTILLC